MITLPTFMMYLSIVIFFGATISTIIVFLNKLGFSKVEIPLINSGIKDTSFNKKVISEICLMCISSRIIIFIIGSIGYMLVKDQNLNIWTSFPTLFTKWDGNHYINIAENWYVNYGDNKFLLVFFPLYPILIRLASTIFIDPVISGVLVSNISLIVGCVYLYKLTLLDFDQGTAYRAVKYLLIFPVSFFLGITFSESLFFALTVSSFYYLRNKKYFISAVISYFAALTRSFGLLLIIPVVTQLLIDLFKNRESINKEEILNRLSNILAPLLGFSTYLLINFRISGNAFTFLKYQKEHWSQTIGFFGTTIKMLAVNSVTKGASESASLWQPQLIIIFAALLLLCFSVQRLNLSYVTYMIGYIFLTISPTWLLSAPRYLMCLFPLLIITGEIGKNRAWDFVISLSMAIGLGFCTIAFVNGYYIM